MRQENSLQKIVLGKYDIKLSYSRGTVGGRLSEMFMFVVQGIALLSF